MRPVHDFARRELRIDLVDYPGCFGWYETDTPDWRAETFRKSWVGALKTVDAQLAYRVYRWQSR